MSETKTSQQINKNSKKTNKKKGFFKNKFNKVITSVAAVVVFASLAFGLSFWRINQSQDSASANQPNITLAPGETVQLQFYYGNETDKDEGNTYGNMDIRLGLNLEILEIYDVFDTDGDGDYSDETRYEICSNILEDISVFVPGIGAIKTGSKMNYLPRSAANTNSCSGTKLNGSSDLALIENGGLPLGEITNVGGERVYKKFGRIEIKTKLNPDLFNVINSDTLSNFKNGDLLDFDLNGEGAKNVFSTRVGVNGDVRSAKDNFIIKLGGTFISPNNLSDFTCTETGSGNSQILIGNTAVCEADLTGAPADSNAYIIPDDFNLVLGDSSEGAPGTQCVINNNGVIGADVSLTCTAVPTTNATENPNAPINVTTNNQGPVQKGTTDLKSPANPVTIADVIDTDDCTNSNVVTIPETFTCTYTLLSGKQYTPPVDPITARVINSPSVKLAESPNCTLVENNTKLECAGIPSENGTQDLFKAKPIELTQVSQTVEKGEVILVNPALTLDDIDSINCEERVLGQATNCTVTLQPGNYIVPQNFRVKVGEALPNTCSTAFPAIVSGSFSCNNVTTTNAATNEELQPNGQDVPTDGVIGANSATKGITPLLPQITPVVTEDIESLVCNPDEVILKTGQNVTTNCTVTLKQNGKQGGVTVRLGDENNNTGDNCTVNFSGTETSGTCTINNIDKIDTFPSQGFVDPADTPFTGNDVTVLFDKDGDDDNDDMTNGDECGQPAGQEPNGENCVDTDGDGKDDYQDPDSDDDGIDDIIEKDCTPGVGSGIPCDTDGDDIPDYLDQDADDDGIPDVVEAVCTIGIGSGSPCDSDGDQIPDYRDLDTDDDTLPDTDEKGPDLGCNWNTYPPSNCNAPADKDNDQIPDYRDVSVLGDDVIYLIPDTRIKYTPDKKTSFKFNSGTDLQIEIEHAFAPSITQCTIERRLYGSNDTWTDMNASISGNLCRATFPSDDQIDAKWDFRLRLTDSNNERWGSDPSYFMKYGAAATIQLNAQVLP